MSEQKHTPGTLEVIEYGDAVLAYGWELVDDGSDPGAVAVCYREEGVDAEANARRLAACWNACQGIPTEALGDGVIGDLVELCIDSAVNEVGSAGNLEACRILIRMPGNGNEGIISGAKRILEDDAKRFKANQ